MKPGPPSLENTADRKYQEKGCVQLISPFVEKNTKKSFICISE